MLLSNSVFASPQPNLYAFDNKLDQGDTTNTVATILGKVINFIQVIGAGIAIIILIVIAIKWIYSAPEGKAQIAKSARMYILGTILIFAAIGLLQIVKNFTITNVKNAVTITNAKNVV
jgi:hypothetical protein